MKSNTHKTRFASQVKKEHMTKQHRKGKMNAEHWKFTCTFKRFGTLRCMGATHRSPPRVTVRGKGEFCQQLRFSDKYLNYLKETGAIPGYIVNPVTLLTEGLCCVCASCHCVFCVIRKNMLRMLQPAFAPRAIELLKNTVWTAFAPRAIELLENTVWC